MAIVSCDSIICGIPVQTILSRSHTMRHHWTDVGKGVTRSPPAGAVGFRVNLWVGLV